MSSGEQHPLTRLLLTARQQRQPVTAAGWESTLAGAEQAYAVQREVAVALGWFGQDAPESWKSGGASRDAVLTHAPLASENVRTSPARFNDLPLNAPGVEAEIALRLARTVTPSEAARLTPQSTGDLVDAMTVSIEVVDSRWQQGPQAPALLRLADHQSHAALALGDWVPYAARDWSAQRCEMRIGDGPLLVRTGSLPLGDPAWLLPQWLQHVTRKGDSVSAGTVVTTGSWVGVVPVDKGDAVYVDFAGIGTAKLVL